MLRCWATVSLSCLFILLHIVSIMDTQHHTITAPCSSILVLGKNHGWLLKRIRFAPPIEMQLEGSVLVAGVLELRQIKIESWKWRDAKNCSSRIGHLRLAPRVSEPCGSWNNHVDSVMVIWNKSACDAMAPSIYTGHLNTVKGRMPSSLRFKLTMKLEPRTFLQ